MKPRKVWYLFNRPRAERERLTLAGRWPEEGVYGFNRLRKRGYDTQFSDEGHQRSALQWGLKRLEDLLSDKGRKVGFNLAQAWALRRRLEQVDLIFATADSSALGALALKAAGILHTPLVYASIGLVEGFEGSEGPRLSLYRRLIRQAECVIHYGYEEGPRLKSVFHVPEDRIQFVPFCVETEFFSLQSDRDGNPLAVGLDHRRDWPLLFQAAKALPFTIDLICNPDTVKDHDVPPNVKIIQPLPMVDLREKIARARFVVLPVKQNAYTGATITLLQSMAAACATIVTRTKAIENGYHLRDQENCLLVPPGQTTALEEAMRSLFDDPAFCRRLGEKARETVCAEHDIGHYVAQLDSIFQKVLARGAAGD